MTYYEYIEEQGHVLKRDEYGEVDCFVLDFDYHNGPGCVNCHDSWCEHCEDKVEQCIGKEEYEKQEKERRYQQYIKLKEEFE